MEKQIEPIRSVTLRDVGKSLGISHVAVSLALRNAPQISIARRRQIHKKAREMGYRPNPMATALGHLRFAGKARAVTAGLAWVNYREDSQSVRRFKEFDLYWKGAFQTAKWYGYNLEEFVCNADFSLSRLQEVLVARGVNGILIPPHPKLPADWDAFQWEHFSAIRFGHSILKPNVHVVTSDQITNSLLAFSQMRAKGYERIGFVSIKSNRTRHKAGVLMAQSELHPNQQIPPLLFLSNTNNCARQESLRLWMKKWKPDAILTDVAAIPAILEKAGYHVPKDVGLAVFSVLDGNADAGIYQNPEEIGKAAVEMLISLINHSHTGVPKICRQLLIEGRWVDGSSLPDKNLARRASE